MPVLTVWEGPDCHLVTGRTWALPIVGVHCDDVLLICLQPGDVNPVSDAIHRINRHIIGGCWAAYKLVWHRVAQYG